MAFSVYDLMEFYNTRLGRTAEAVLQSHIRSLWPDMRNMRLMGLGYATPYIAQYVGEADRVVGIMTPTLGAYPWPVDDKNLVCLADEAELPLETNPVDRIIVVHTLEFTHHSGRLFEELWRVLKSNGRLMIVVPNRLGLWSRVDRTPFGHGRPYSATQIAHQLREYRFMHERTRHGFFMLPIGSQLILRTAAFLERYGRYVFPALAGLHIVEASKQLYAGTAIPVDAGRKLRTRPEPALIPTPSITSKS